MKMGWYCGSVVMYVVMAGSDEDGVVCGSVVMHVVMAGSDEDRVALW